MLCHTSIFSPIFSTMKGFNASLLAVAAIGNTSAFFVPTLAKSNALNGSRRFSSAAKMAKFPIQGDEQIMSKKAHGTSEKPVMSELRWNCDFSTADRICVSTPLLPATSILGS